MPTLPAHSDSAPRNFGRVLWLAAFVVTLCLVAFALRAALFTSPTPADMGHLGRAIYYHVPTAMLSFLFPYINLAAAITFLVLRTRNPLSALAADALAVAAAEVTIVYAFLTLVTGSIWGRAAWGIWWTWDARLTLELLLFLLYVSYLITRRLSNTGQTSTISAVLAIFAAIDIPINYMSIRWFRTQHPQPVFAGGPGSGLDPTLRPAFYSNLVAWLSWGLVVLALRYALERRRQAVQQDLTLAALEATLTPNDTPNDPRLGQESPRAR